MKSLNVFLFLSTQYESAKLNAMDLPLLLAISHAFTTARIESGTSKRYPSMYIIK